jgi:hypothetical protein
MQNSTQNATSQSSPQRTPPPPPRRRRIGLLGWIIILVVIGAVVTGLYKVPSPIQSRVQSVVNVPLGFVTTLRSKVGVPGFLKGISLPKIDFSGLTKYLPGGSSTAAEEEEGLNPQIYGTGSMCERWDSDLNFPDDPKESAQQGTTVTVKRILLNCGDQAWPKNLILVKAFGTVGVAEKPVSVRLYEPGTTTPIGVVAPGQRVEVHFDLELPVSTFPGVQSYEVHMSLANRDSGEAFTNRFWVKILATPKT